jgi:DNA-binding transcriptional LysR family regulator
MLKIAECLTEKSVWISLMSKRLFARAGISLERLRTFLEVVVAGGISHAAPADSTRQSQFSRQLKELEDFFGAELLRRTRGNFELTPAGRDLFQIVSSHFDALEELADRCAKENVEVNVGAGESLLHGLVLPCISEFRAKHPKTTLVLHNLRNADISKGLLNARLDIGILREDSVTPALKSVRLGVIEYGLVVLKDSLRKSEGNDGWDVLTRFPVAFLAGSDIVSALEDQARGKNRRLDICFLGSSYAQLLDAVKSIKCAAIMPVLLSKSDRANLTVLDLPALAKFQRCITLAWNPRFVRLRPAVDSAIQALSQALRQRFERYPQRN